MMSTIQIPPTPAVLECADLLNDAIGRALKRRETIPSWGEYEADSEAHIQLLMAIRHVEAVTELARADLCLLPAAMVLARAAFETSVTVMWLMTPSDPFEREARWMAKLAEYARAYDRMADQIARLGVDVSSLRQISAQVKQFYDGILGQFPSGYSLPKGVPSVDKMLEDLQFDGQYARYIHASQFAHACLMGTEIYRAGIGAQPLTERITPYDWCAPFTMAWMSLNEPWRMYLTRAGGDVRGYPAPGLVRHIRRAVENLQR